MARLLQVTPVLAVILYQFVGEFCRFDGGVMRPLVLVLTLMVVPVLGYRRWQHQASGVDMTMGVYLVLAALGFWVLPASLGLLMTHKALTILYILLFCMAGLGLVPPAEPFTSFYARRSAPPEVWETPLFKLINRRLTAFWAGLFALSAASTLVPEFWGGLNSSRLRLIFTLGIPLIFMVGIGVRMNKWYPNHMVRRHLAQQIAVRQP
jgi:hypothetical protein